MLPPGRAGFIIMMVLPLIVKQLAWINQKIILKQAIRADTAVPDAELYRSLALLLFSHLTGITVETSIVPLSKLGLVKMSKDRFDTMVASLCSFSPTINGGAIVG